MLHACLKGFQGGPLSSGRGGGPPSVEVGQGTHTHTKRRGEREGGMAVVVGGERPVSAAFLPQPGHWAAGVGSTFRSGGDWAAGAVVHSLDLRW